ncbi:hypothetical protein GIB67_018696 [Kingdonia uniflora]|uniref:CCHC-type domain-containing protein n=1 Tax=Kingdonia uniflora TaxID=39325 RepID=A0A7J7L252_9MAGN|nr:hypothetical protein GIB67_018696 [Kingdonia uniflora]
MPPISGIPTETSAMAVRYAYPALPSVLSQTSHTSLTCLSPLPAASGNSCPPRKKCDYYGKWGHLKTTCHVLHGRPAGYQPRLSQSSTHLSANSSALDSSAFSALSQDEINSFIEWPAGAPSKKVPISHTVAEIYAKIVEKTRVFQFLTGLNPDFEYARVHLLDRTHFPTLEEAHAYCFSYQSRRSPMPPISRIPSETSAMAIHYAYPAPPSVPSQTSHTSSPSLSPLPTASGNSRPSRKKCDYCGKWGHLKTTCHALHSRPAGYQPRPSQSSTNLSADSSVPDSSAFSALSQDEISRF